MHKLRLCSVMAFILVVTSCAGVIQGEGNSHRQGPMARKEINAVLKEHDKELLAIPGVIGVYVGLLPDNKTPCLKIMVIKVTEDLKRRIPKFIDGYPVLIEESGVIRPLKDHNPGDS